jgi:large subunit ribosomal protein L11
MNTTPTPSAKTFAPHTMAKKLVKKIKIIASGGAAAMTPAMGQVLGPAGINIGEFIKKFNEASKEMRGDMVPAVISVYEDRSYDFVLKTPPASSLILKALGKEKGSGKPNTSKVGALSKAQLKEIAEKKMPDLNAHTIEEAMKIVAGSARSMGVDVK